MAGRSEPSLSPFFEIDGNRDGNTARNSYGSCRRSTPRSTPKSSPIIELDEIVESEPTQDFWGRPSACYSPCYPASAPAMSRSSSQNKLPPLFSNASPPPQAPPRCTHTGAVPFDDDDVVSPHESIPIWLGLPPIDGGAPLIPANESSPARTKRSRRASAASYGSTDSGVSHPPSKERRSSKVVPIKIKTRRTEDTGQASVNLMRTLSGSNLGAPSKSSLVETTLTDASPFGSPLSGRCDLINETTGKPGNMVFSRPGDWTRDKNAIHIASKAEERYEDCRHFAPANRLTDLAGHHHVACANEELPSQYDVQSAYAAKRKAPQYYRCGVYDALKGGPCRDIFSGDLELAWHRSLRHARGPDRQSLPSAPGELYHSTEKFKAPMPPKDMTPSHAYMVAHHREDFINGSSVTGGHKRGQACERCHMTRTKCDGEVPCKRCKDDGVLCPAGVRFGLESQQLPRDDRVRPSECTESALDEPMKASNSAPGNVPGISG